MSASTLPLADMVTARIVCAIYRGAARWAYIQDKPALKLAVIVAQSERVERVTYLKAGYVTRIGRGTAQENWRVNDLRGVNS